MAGWLPGWMVGSITVEHLGSQTKEFGDKFFFEYREWHDQNNYLEISSCDTVLESLEKGKPEGMEIVTKLFYILPMDQ